jgi:hypothetical protein
MAKGHAQSAITGRYISHAAAARHPRTSVTESGSNWGSGTHHPSAITGHFISGAAAARHPNTSVTERADRSTKQQGPPQSQCGGPASFSPDKSGTAACAARIPLAQVDGSGSGLAGARAAGARLPGAGLPGHGGARVAQGGGGGDEAAGHGAAAAHCTHPEGAGADLAHRSLLRRLHFCLLLLAEATVAVLAGNGRKDVAAITPPGWTAARPTPPPARRAPRPTHPGPDSLAGS